MNAPASTPTSAEHALVQAWRAGDEAAAEQLIDQHTPHLDAFFYTKVGNIEQAKDLRQETLCRLVKAIDHFRYESRFSTFLFGIAIRVFWNWRHREARHHGGVSQTPIDQLGPLIAVDCINPSRLDQLAALRTLDPDKLILIELWALGYSYAEIQCLVAPGVPLGTIGARISRIRIELNRALGEDRGRPSPAQLDSTPLTCARPPRSTHWLTLLLRELTVSMRAANHQSGSADL